MKVKIHKKFPKAKVILIFYRKTGYRLDPSNQEKSREISRKKRKKAAEFGEITADFFSRVTRFILFTIYREPYYFFSNASPNFCREPEFNHFLNLKRFMKFNPKIKLNFIVKKMSNKLFYYLIGIQISDRLVEVYLLRRYKLK